MNSKFLITLLSLLILSGCTTLHEPHQPIPWAARQQTLSHIQQWNIQGLIAIQSPQQSASAHWQWQQQLNDYTMFFIGPFGTGTAKLAGTPKRVTLTTADGNKLQAPSPELLLKQLGWQLPVSHLYYWIRGLPAPTFPAEKKLDASQHLVQLTQQGWTIQFSNYASVRNVDLPNKIFLTNPTLHIKIIITRWDIEIKT